MRNEVDRLPPFVGSAFLSFFLLLTLRGGEKKKEGVREMKEKRAAGGMVCQEWILHRDCRDNVNLPSSLASATKHGEVARDDFIPPLS